MEASQIAALLGLASNDPRVEEQLRRFDIDDRPQVHVDPNDVDGPIVETQDWVINSSSGIEFGFEAQAAFMGLDPPDRGSGPMILTEIYLYGYYPRVRPFGGLLPFGVELTDGRQAVRTKLSSLERARRSYVRDTWELDTFRMTISYSDGGSRIGFILCLLPYEPSLPFEQGATLLPKMKAVIPLLGKRRDDPMLRAIFVPLGLSRQTREATDLVATFRSTYGFDLGFSEPRPIPGTLGDQVGSLTLSQILCYRDREMDARGWRGDLPFDILFDDSPETVEEKVGRPPDARLDQEFTGFAVWHFDAFSMCVHYSTMENIVLRVRIMAPGEWARYEIS